PLLSLGIRSSHNPHYMKVVQNALFYKGYLIRKTLKLSYPNNCLRDKLKLFFFSPSSWGLLAFPLMFFSGRMTNPYSGYSYETAVLLSIGVGIENVRYSRKSEL
ncbi:hypothetical protein, partial [Glaesserella parasuis]